MNIQLNNVQEKLVSGTSIKTVNGQTILGSGDVNTTNGYQGTIEILDVKTIDGFYTPIDEGTYPNVGGLTYLPTTTDKGFQVYFILTGATWVKSRVDLGIDINTVPLNSSYSVPNTNPENGVYNIILKGYSEGDSFVLHRIYNRTNGALIEIKDSQNVLVCKFNRFYQQTTNQTGIEKVELIEHGGSGITGTCTVNWDIFSKPNTNSIIILNIPINLAFSDFLRSGAFPPEGGAEFPWDRNVNPSPMLEITQLEIVNTDYGSLVKYNGEIKKIYLSRADNFNSPTFGNRSLLEFKDETNTVVCWFYIGQQPSIRIGVEEVLCIEQNSSGINIRATVNWDLLAGLGTLTFNQEIDSNIVLLGVINSIDNSNSNPILNFFDPTKSILPKNSNAIDLCSDFRQKMLSRDDVNIVFFGDSLFAKTDTVTQLSAEELKTSHVWIPSKTTLKNLYENYSFNKTDSFRFDSNLFTEQVGTWTDSFDIFNNPIIPLWSGSNRQEGNRSRYSTDSGAEIKYTWDLSKYEKSNFVYDLDTRGAKVITLSITEGSGKVEIYNGSNWVEANSYVVNQWINPSIATEGSGNSLGIQKVRLKMRRIVDDQQVEISLKKDTSSDYFFYWGAEFWNGKTIHFHNAARGGHKTERLINSINDLGKYNPDLIVFETPLINESFPAYTVEEIANKQTDFIWGDRTGYENSLSLKKIYPSVDLVVVLPHLQSSGYTLDNPIIFEGLNGTPIDLINEVKGIFATRVDESYIDIFQEMLYISKMNEWTLSQAFSPSSNSTTFPTSFFKDNAHQNDYGAQVWSSILKSNLTVK